MGQINSLPNIHAAVCLKPLCASLNHDPTVGIPTVGIPTLADPQAERIFLATAYLPSSQSHKQQHIIFEDSSFAPW